MRSINRASTTRRNRSTAVSSSHASALGPEHPDTLTSVNNLAGLYRSQGRYGEAEPLTAARSRRASGCSAPSIPTRSQRQQPGGPLPEPGPLWRGGAALPPRARGERAGARPRASRHAHQRPQRERASARMAGRCGNSSRGSPRRSAASSRGRRGARSSGLMLSSVSPTVASVNSKLKRRGPALQGRRCRPHE